MSASSASEDEDHVDKFEYQSPLKTINLKLVAAANSGVKSPDSATVEHSFRCYHVGQFVNLFGDFNKWMGQPMLLAINQNTGGKLFELTVTGLKPQTRYEYCFMVDGKWLNSAKHELSPLINPVT